GEPCPGAGGAGGGLVVKGGRGGIVRWSAPLGRRPVSPPLLQDGAVVADHLERYGVAPDPDFHARMLGHEYYAPRVRVAQLDRTYDALREWLALAGGVGN